MLRGNDVYTKAMRDGAFFLFLKERNQGEPAKHNLNYYNYSFLFFPFLKLSKCKKQASTITYSTSPPLSLTLFLTLSPLILPSPKDRRGRKSFCTPNRTTQPSFLRDTPTPKSNAISLVSFFHSQRRKEEEKNKGRPPYGFIAPAQMNACVLSLHMLYHCTKEAEAIK